MPITVIHQNVKKEIDIKYPSTGKLMEFDIWIPKHNLFFEFQDAYHYMTTWYSQYKQEFVSEKDNIKLGLAQQSGVSLIVVPCWWDGTVERLAATIEYQRPDLDLLLDPHHTMRAPISLNPPFNFFQEPKIPNIEGLMLASFPLNKFNETISENQWWMGEKYDGIRCCWNPIRNMVYLYMYYYAHISTMTKQIYTRYGKLVPLPSIVTHRLPPFLFIDGEIWFGRGQYLLAYAISSGNELPNWSQLRLVSFDVPSYDYHDVVYETRYAALVKKININHPFNVIVPRTLCTSKTIAWVQRIISEGGEGMIMQKRNSQYDSGRSENIVKLKTAQGDQEGIVIHVSPDNSVTLKLVEGSRITVARENTLIQTLSVGDIVSFYYDSNSRRDMPINPKIYRVRTDVVWEDLLHGHFQENQLGASSQVRGYTTKPKGFWSPKNMREYMENFAKNRNMDPLKSATWYNSYKAFFKSKSGRTIISKFKKGYYNALQQLFPEVKFDPAVQQFFKIENRRKFFEDYASNNNFDPLVADNWYAQTINCILDTKGSRGVIAYHKYSVPRALMDLFPNIGLDRSKFGLVKNHWESAENRRKLFESYAHKNGFDPLDADHWYAQNRSKIMEMPGIQIVLLHHGNSVSTALGDLFPHIGLDKTKFLLQSFWSKISNRKKFFERYAENKSFDPLIASNWYSQPRKDILAVKGANSVIAYHGHSVFKALSDLFPNVHFEKSKFVFISDWNSPKTRRHFFENFATKHNFDPLDPKNWYSQIAKILSYKNSSKVVLHHDNSVIKSLKDLFPNVTFDESKFQLPKKAWETAEQRRQFFVEYAVQNEFDPLIAENWYTQPLSKIMSTKKIYDVVLHHNRSVVKALVDLFPDVGLEESKFGNLKKYWAMTENRRKFFENYARSHDFDPLVPANWYNLHLSSLLSEKGASRILPYHANSLSQALVDLFPDISMDPYKFSHSNKSWEKSESREKFFKVYAENNAFDPLLADNWYKSTHRSKILSSKGAMRVLGHHNYSISKALIDLFPSVAWDPVKLRTALL